jgi:hypothetical protein
MGSNHDEAVATARLHIVDIQFEDGRWAHVVIRDEPEESTVSVSGLRHVAKIRHEHIDMKKVELPRG